LYLVNAKTFYGALNALTKKKTKDGVWSFPPKNQKRFSVKKRPKMVYGVFRQKNQKRFSAKKTKKGFLFCTG